MDTYEQLDQRREVLLKKIADLGPMRAGSINERMLPLRCKDGSVHRRGPYWMYTYKDNGKTRGKWLHGQKEIDIYRCQIETRRHFEEFSRELATLSQKMADLQAHEREECKKNSRRSSPTSRRQR